MWHGLLDSLVEVSHVKHARRIGVPPWVLRELLEHGAWTISRRDRDTLYLDAAIDLPTRAEVEDRARDRLRALLQEALAVAEAMEREVGVVIVALREAVHDGADRWSWSVTTCARSSSTVGPARTGSIGSGRTGPSPRNGPSRCTGGSLTSTRPGSRSPRAGQREPRSGQGPGPRSTCRWRCAATAPNPPTFERRRAPAARTWGTPRSEPSSGARA